MASWVRGRNSIIVVNIVRRMWRNARNRGTCHKWKHLFTGGSNRQPKMLCWSSCSGGATCLVGGGVLERLRVLSLTAACEGLLVSQGAGAFWITSSVDANPEPSSPALESDAKPSPSDQSLSVQVEGSLLSVPQPFPSMAWKRERNEYSRETQQAVRKQ